MASELDKLVQERLRHGQLFFSYTEIRNLTGRLINIMLKDLMAKNKIDQETYELIGKQFALKMGLWELYPKPDKTSVPDPNTVKVMIRTRLSGAKTKIMFPDMKLPSREDTRRVHIEVDKHKPPPKSGA